MTQNNKLADWESCPTGGIQRVARVNKFSRRRLILKLGAVASVLGSGLLAKNLLFQPRTAVTEPECVGKICCQHVRQNLRAYLAGDIADRGLIERISAHLKDCSSCRSETDYILNRCDI